MKYSLQTTLLQIYATTPYFQAYNVLSLFFKCVQQAATTVTFFYIVHVNTNIFSFQGIVSTSKLFKMINFLHLFQTF